MLKLEMAFPIDMYVRQVIENYSGLSCLVLWKKSEIVLLEWAAAILQSPH